MAVTLRDGERYTLRRQVFKLFGAGFHIYGAEGAVVAYCKQKAFRLREDLRVYTGDDCATELFRITTRQIIDFSATYTVLLPTGETLGMFRRLGMKSMLRDEWAITDGAGREIARAREDSTTRAVLRRLSAELAALMPERITVTLPDGALIATYRTHFNPFIYRLGVAVHADHEELDDLMLLAGACLIGAIEGRQR